MTNWGMGVEIEVWGDGDWIFLASQIHRNKVEWWLARAGEREKENLLFKGYKVSILQGEKVKSEYT